MADPFTCPCCGYLAHVTPPGRYELCPICFWEDDPAQAADPWLPDGANKVSLADAQRNYLECSASDPRFAADVRAPTGQDLLDPAWRPLRESDRQHVVPLAAIERGVDGAGRGPSYRYWLRDREESGIG